MPEEIRHADGRIEHPEVRSEPSDASFGWIASILAGAAVVLVLVHFAVMAFFTGYRDHLAQVDRSSYGLAPGPFTAVPPPPRLEQIDRLPPYGISEPGAASAVAQRETAKLRTLNSYGPAEAPGFIHIPIDRAMQLLVEKNMLKARPQPVDERQRSMGLVDAGEPNSGRLLRGGQK